MKKAERREALICEKIVLDRTWVNLASDDDIARGEGKMELSKKIRTKMEDINDEIAIIEYKLETGNY